MTMTPVTVAITHTTVKEDVRLELEIHRRVAIGTNIKCLSNDKVDARAKRDLDLLARLGREGGFAVVTFGNDSHLTTRYLAEFSSCTEVEDFKGLRSIRYRDICSLPSSLRHINTIGNAILEVEGDDRELILVEARRRRWSV